MAETWYPNPSVTQLQHERLMGEATPSGVFGTPADLPVVYAPGSGTRDVRIRASRRAIVEGYGWENDSVEIVLPALAANATGSTRIDLIVLRLDRSDWSVKVKVVQGTAGAGAPAPTNTLGSAGVWELPLAEVVVASGATTLAGSTVTNRAWYMGSNGQIICTLTTRPPAEFGLTAWDTTLATQIISDGTVWRRSDWFTAWGRITGERYNGGAATALAINATSESFANIDPGSANLIAGRSYKIPVILRAKVGTVGDYIFRIRDTNLAGSVRGYRAVYIPTTTGTYEVQLTGYYDCVANTTIQWQVTTAGAGAVTVYAGDGAATVIAEVIDVGPTALTSVP